MTRINFNRNSNGGGYPPPANHPVPGQPEDQHQPSLLTRIADHCARLGKAGYSIPGDLQVDGVAVAQGTELQRWAADLGHREGVNTRMQMLRAA